MPQKKRRKKIFAIVGLLLVGLVAVGGYQMFMTEDGEAALPSAPSEPGFVPMKPFLAPIIEGRRISKYVAVGVILELYDEDDEAMVREFMTPLRNAFIDDFVFQAQMNAGHSQTVYLPRVKKRFHTLVVRIVGPDIVSEVLISHTVDRGF
jgi:flagellar basal body-associated protein FliL